MKKTFLVNTAGKYGGFELSCGNCDGVIYGYDEEICPSCGCFIDMNDERKAKVWFPVKGAPRMSDVYSSK